MLVVPAKAGTHTHVDSRGAASRLRGNDKRNSERCVLGTW